MLVLYPWTESGLRQTECKQLQPFSHVESFALKFFHLDHEMRDRVGDVRFKVFQRLGRIDTTDESPLLAMNRFIGLCEQVEFETALEYAIPAAFTEFRSRTCIFGSAPSVQSPGGRRRATYHKLS